MDAAASCLYFIHVSVTVVQGFEFLVCVCFVLTLISYVSQLTQKLWDLGWVFSFILVHTVVSSQSGHI